MDAATELTLLGGHYRHDEDGDFWEFVAGEFTVQVEPSFRKSSRGLMLGIDCAIEHRDFALVVREILGDSPDSFQCMLYQQRTAKIQSSLEAVEAFRSLVLSTLDAIRTMNLSDLLADFSANRPDRRGMPQVLHLAALAWRGDYSTLDEYQRLFARGRRLNFVPLITKRMIDSALSIANQRFAESFEDDPKI